jgi:hypothetical protein
MFIIIRNINISVKLIKLNRGITEWEIINEIEIWWDECANKFLLIIE